MSKPTDEEILDGLMGLVAVIMIVAALLALFYYFKAENKLETYGTQYTESA